MLTPDVVVDSVRDATPELLERLGVHGVLIDLDDTMIASGGTSLELHSREWLSGLQEAGYPVVLLSNGERERVERFCSDTGIEGLHLAGKPFWWAFRRGLKLLGKPANEAAMVGDQVFTDVLGANLSGMTSILVRPLSSGKLPHTRVARRLEKFVLRGGTHGRTVNR